MILLPLPPKSWNYRYGPPYLATSDFSSRCLLEILRTFERAHQVTYSQSSKIATLMKQVSTRYVDIHLQGTS
jgi:hypothetical protein